MKRVATRRPEGPGVDDVIEEEPLEIRVEGQAAAVTMRTPGHDLDLAVGFLLTEGVIDGIDDVRAVASVAENVVDVRLAEGVPLHRQRLADRQIYASSSCGICGKASLDRVRARVPRREGWLPEPGVIDVVLAAVATQQAEFAATGGCHAAALFDRVGAVLLLREDVGRHNAVDKVLGAHLRAGGDAVGLGLCVSSRAGFEVVQKASVAGVGAVIAVGAPTSLAIDGAHDWGVGLVCWARGGRWAVY
ncbi:MAG: formate dehydrogenase accessory sulfurtransferase FdhD [Deltaproteobacteria bacterium]|nr:formate dehydrogenase accessory sulfurtransferase FdhD [Deltaproteobacteria bacterium]